MLDSSSWPYTTKDLVDILQCQYDKMMLPMVGTVFFEQGWLAESAHSMRYTASDAVGLGDIGYVDENGKFVVVDNVHHHMQGEAGLLSWNNSQALCFYSGNQIIEHTPGEAIFSHARQAYRGRSQVHCYFCVCLVNRSL